MAICKHQLSRQSPDGEMRLYCMKQKSLCTHQRFCRDKGKYVLGDKAEWYCKGYQRV